MLALAKFLLIYFTVVKYIEYVGFVMFCATNSIVNSLSHALNSQSEIIVSEQISATVPIAQTFVSDIAEQLAAV